MFEVRCFEVSMVADRARCTARGGRARLLKLWLSSRHSAIDALNRRPSPLPSRGRMSNIRPSPLPSRCRNLNIRPSTRPERGRSSNVQVSRVGALGRTLKFRFRPKWFDLSGVHGGKNNTPVEPHNGQRHYVMYDQTQTRDPSRVSAVRSVAAVSYSILSRYRTALYE